MIDIKLTDEQQKHMRESLDTFTDCLDTHYMTEHDYFEAGYRAAYYKNEVRLDALVNMAIEAEQEYIIDLEAALRHCIDAICCVKSWAKNWDSVFMNDPDWKSVDGPMVESALTKAKKVLE